MADDHSLVASYFSPRFKQLDGFYRFELHRRDEHEIVKMLVDLSVREPGEVSAASQSQSIACLVMFLHHPFACRNRFIVRNTNVHQNWSEEAYNNKPFELPLSWVEPEMVRSHALNLHWRQASVGAFTLIEFVADGRRHRKGPRQRAPLSELQNVARMQAHARETAHV